MSEENKALILRMYDAINSGNFDVIYETTTEDFVEHEELPGMTPNREGAIKFFKMTKAAFPDLVFEMLDMIAEGDKVFVRAVLKGTHKGEFMGVPASGNQVAVPFGDYFKIVNGKVSDHWGVTDTGTLMQQLGAS